MADLLFFQDLFTDNTKMPKNRLPAQPLWRTINTRRFVQFKAAQEFTMMT